MTIGLNIKLARTKKRLTQQELADKIGIKQGQLSRYERDEQEPTFGVVQRIADALGMTIDEMMR